MSSVDHLTNEHLLKGGVMEKKIDQEALKELEASKNEVLKRVAEKLKEQLQEGEIVCGYHSSHSSGSAGRTHTSTTSH